MKKHLHLIYLFGILIFLFCPSNKIHACTGRDVIFTSITFTSISSGNYQYSYQIKNIGTTDIAINQLVIQNYVSTDNQVGGDAAAGGSYINNTSSLVLAAGATYNGTYGASPFPANPQSSYPYLIANVFLGSDPECDVTNNNYITLVEMSTSLHSSLLSNVSVNWNADTKSFIVNDWPGSDSQLKYSIYALSGMLVNSGHTKDNEPTPLNALPGNLYILILSDGEKMYAKKITY